MDTQSAFAEPPSVATTSIFVSLQSRLAQVHANGKMGAFAGPPGIGKTTAIRCFARSRPLQVALPLVRREGASPTTVLQAMLAAVRTVNGSDARHTPNDARRVEGYLETAIKDWSRHATRQRHWDDEAPVKLSLVFDEAQSLGSKMIDMLRFWNDGTESVPSLGIVFVGNDQFRLNTSDAGPSFLSAPVASRTGRNRKTWTYADVTDDDVRLVAMARGVDDAHALEALVERCHRTPGQRDLRILNEDLDRAFQLARGAPITGALIVRLLAA